MRCDERSPDSGLSATAPIADIGVFRHRALMRDYRAVRKLVDRDLAATGYVRSGGCSLVIALLLACLPLPVVARPYSLAEQLLIAGAILTSFGWLTFVAWRGIRIFRASVMRGDRTYDRQDKHLLSADYATTESETKARRSR